MSIARRPARDAKVRKDLNIPPCGFCAIKVLTDLENWAPRLSIDIKVLTDLKRFRRCIQSRCAAPKPRSSCQSCSSCFRQPFVTFFRGKRCI